VPRPDAIAAKRITKADFIRQLSRICDARHRAIVSLDVPFTSPGDYAKRGSDLMRIEANARRAEQALPRPADHRLIDRASDQVQRYLHVLPPLVDASKHRQRRAWALMYEAHGYLSNASDIIQAYAHRRFCYLGP
jgi:hypothetical protein